MSINMHPVTVPDHIRVTRLELANRLEKHSAKYKQWYDFAVPEDYRQARKKGTHGFEKPVVNDRARLVYANGRDGQNIEIRVIDPREPPKGVFLHFHGGGYVFGSNASYDVYLTRLSEALGLIMASVEYRLAPEHPFPAGRNDAVDATLYALSEEGVRDLGAPLRVLGGESAGGWYAVAVALALRDEYGIDVHSQIAAICAGYGIYDLTYTPSMLLHKRNIILSSSLMMRFVEAAFGHVQANERKKPEISPLYADLHDLPPAHFLVGNIEPLLDDSIFMASRWANAGNHAELDIIEGACHAFTLMPMGDTTEEGLKAVMGFLRRMLESFAARP